MKVRIHHFNLIEIVLAVAVIGFGVVIIIGMLPKGVRATQNAGIESYSSEIIDQMGNFFQQEGAEDVSVKVDSDSKEKELIKKFADDGADADAFIMAHYTELIPFSNSWEELKDDGALENFQRTPMPNVFKLRQDGDLDDIDQFGDLYVVVAGSSFDDDGEIENKTDFSGLLRVWKRPLEYQTVGIEHQANSKHDCIDENCAEHYEMAWDKTWGAYATVCIELSYPLSLPYAERTKRYYCFDVEKQE